ncbi:MAG: hypothetical protein M1832_001413 [Thelocarpon impressellum]|nr:MAG: hypothetical protein M1832_001413 [Thelocarpon impressellum]
MYFLLSDPPLADAGSQIAASFLTSAGVLKPSEKINYSDYKVGIPSMLLCIEMAIFSVMHLFAFPYAEYRLSQVASDSDGNTIYQGGFLGWNAYVNAYNPWDIVKAVGRSFRWLFVGRRRRLEDSSYKDHMDGVGLEPTRTRSEYVGAAPTPDHAAGVHLPMKKAKYQRLDEHDDGRYVSQTQPRPSHGGVAYDAPVLGRFESAHVGDRGEHRRWESEPEPDRLTTWHPGPATVDSRRQQRSEPGYGSLVRDEAAWGGGEKGRPGLR